MSFQQQGGGEARGASRPGPLLRQSCFRGGCAHTHPCSPQGVWKGMWKEGPGTDEAACLCLPDSISQLPQCSCLVGNVLLWSLFLLQSGKLLGSHIQALKNIQLRYPVTYVSGYLSHGSPALIPEGILILPINCILRVKKREEQKIVDTLRQNREKSMMNRCVTIPSFRKSHCLHSLPPFLFCFRADPRYHVINTYQVFKGEILSIICNSLPCFGIKTARGDRVVRLQNVQLYIVCWDRKGLVLALLPPCVTFGESTKL